MSRAPNHRLIDLGRKAGLGTNELYRALRSRPPEANDRPIGQADGNGFAQRIGSDGQRDYLPVAGGR